MSAQPPLSDAQIEQLSHFLGDCLSGSEISRMLAGCQLEDRSQESTKWKRIYGVFHDYQGKHSCSNHALRFIETVMSPARFVGQLEQFEGKRRYINGILAFSGLELGKEGKFHTCAVAHTLDEAEGRLRTIRAKFQGRALHPEVLKYCRAELMQDNYFHAVFEASKGLAQRIREMSGVDADGASLVDRAFAVDRPMLAFNSLRTETEKSEHKGFAALLKGCFGAIRNPLAHEPKILWHGEDDAADYLSLVSLLHRRLDEATRTGL